MNKGALLDIPQLEQKRPHQWRAAFCIFVYPETATEPLQPDSVCRHSNFILQFIQTQQNRNYKLTKTIQQGGKEIVPT